MEHLDIVSGGEGGEDVKDVEEEEVFRRESAAQGPIIDGEPWLGGDLKKVASWWREKRSHYDPMRNETTRRGRKRGASFRGKGSIIDGRSWEALGN